MGNVVASSLQDDHHDTITIPPDSFRIEDFKSESRESGLERDDGLEQKKVRFETKSYPEKEDLRREKSCHQNNIIFVKVNEKSQSRSSASSSGYESKSCSSSLSSTSEAEQLPVPTAEIPSAAAAVPLPDTPTNPISEFNIESILTCDQCGERFSKSGDYLAHIRIRNNAACEPIDESNIGQRLEVIGVPSEVSKPQLFAESIRKTKSYNQERDLLWIAPEKLRPKSARPEHRILGPLGNSYIHWLTHMERLERLSDDSSDTEDIERSPPSTGESTLC